jgi:hypothetical protein
MPHPLADCRPIVISEIEQFGVAERSLLALSSCLHRQGPANYLLTTMGKTQDRVSFAAGPQYGMKSR